MQLFYLIFTTFTILFVSLEISSADKPSVLLQALQKEEIVPDVIDTYPSKLLNVKYGKVQVDIGSIHTPTEVKDEPTVSWEVKDESKYYTITLIDPDAPSRKEPTHRELKHWLVVNIPSNKISAGRVLAQYIGAGPSTKSGFHRYVFLLYEQPEKIQFDEETISNRKIVGRSKFSIRDFAKKYNLGEPLAANFFQAEYDDYVPMLRRQFIG